MKYLFFNLFLFSIIFGKAQDSTIHVNGRHIYSPSGEKIVLRGMNVMSVWSQDKTGSWLMEEIAKTGANCTRLVWTQNYGHKDQLAKLIDNCVANKMIAMPECHDATGRWDMIDTCINFWKDSTLIDAVKRNQKWCIVNIGNEVGDHNVTAEQFTKEYCRAIDSLRGWGYAVPIVIDASSWGQNVDILFDTWETILAHDSLHNIIFSAHSYWSSTSNYSRIAEKAKNANMPIIIGEGPSITLSAGCKLLDYQKGLKITGEEEIGWLSWSWGAVNNNDCKPYFDHTKNGVFGNWETEYAVELVAGHEYSLMKTSNRPTSMFNDGTVPVSGIQILPYNPSLKLGDTINLSVVVAPANANDKSYKLELIQDSLVIELSDDSSLVIVKKYGTAKLKANSISSGASFISEYKISPPNTNSIKQPTIEADTYPIPLDGNALNINFNAIKTGNCQIISINGKTLFSLDFTNKSYLIISPEKIDYKGIAIVVIKGDDGTYWKKKIIF